MNWSDELESEIEDKEINIDEVIMIYVFNYLGFFFAIFFGILNW